MATSTASKGGLPGNPKQKPLLFFTALPGEGHTYPLINVAAAMIKRGYPVFFHGGAQFETDVRAAGAEEFTSIPGMLDPVPDAHAVLAAGATINDPGLPLFVHGLIHFLYNTMPLRTQLLEDALVSLRERYPDRQIIIVHELCSMNVTPFVYGRALPKGFASFPKTIGIAAVNIAAPSTHAAPFSMGLPFDDSRPCILRNRELHKLANQGPFVPLLETVARVMRDAGCPESKIPKDHPFATWYDAPDVCFQMCSPSMEYPLPDMPRKLHFAGCLPPRVSKTTTTSASDEGLPSWWGDVLQQAGEGREKKKKVIFVSQGTAHVDYNQLILPTMEAFRGRDDVLTVATLGIRGAALGTDSNFEVPANARWTDFLAYDRILPHADVFVCNAGHGSTTHAVTNGVPIVLAGEVLDKREVTLRAVYAGYAWGLESAAPGADKIREGVEAVLADGRFKERAVALKKENEAMDCMATIEKQIVEFTE